MEHYPKPHILNDRADRRFAFEEANIEVGKVLSIDELRIWWAILSWFHEHAGIFISATPLDHLFIHYHSHKKLLNGSWLEALEFQMPGASEVLLKVLEVQDQVYRTRNADGAAQPSSYRPDSK